MQYVTDRVTKIEECTSNDYFLLDKVNILFVKRLFCTLSRVICTLFIRLGGWSVMIQQNTIQLYNV